jgi:hypothetical protein
MIEKEGTVDNSLSDREMRMELWFMAPPGWSQRGREAKTASDALSADYGRWSHERVTEPIERNKLDRSKNAAEPLCMT